MKSNSSRKLIKPSTIEFTREGRRTPGFGFFEWLHGYFYSRWTYFYIGFGVGEHPLARTLAAASAFLNRLAGRKQGYPNNLSSQPRLAQTKDQHGSIADTYHGKVVPLESARQLVSIHEDIKLTNLEKVIPYPHARDIILKNPDHIIVIDCPCRSARQNPCLPIDVCLIVGEPFASFVAEHHPQKSRWISQEEAVEILRAEDERGHAHHAFFKDAMLGRFYAICNCCSCCCGAMHAHTHGTPMLASSGYVCKVDEDLCIACGECVPSCQFHALSLGEFTITVDQSLCMGCGVCMSHCPQGVLSLERDTSRGEPLEILNLLEMIGE